MPHGSNHNFAEHLRVLFHHYVQRLLFAYFHCLLKHTHIGNAQNIAFVNVDGELSVDVGSYAALSAFNHDSGANDRLIVAFTYHSAGDYSCITSHRKEGKYN